MEPLFYSIVFSSGQEKGCLFQLTLYLSWWSSVCLQQVFSTSVHGGRNTPQNVQARPSSSGAFAAWFWQETAFPCDLSASGV